MRAPETLTNLKLKTMKQVLTALIIHMSLATYGQLDIKEVNKSLAKINEVLYASKHEVSNKQYLTFINSLRQAS